jgi:hypothetical protein
MALIAMTTADTVDYVSDLDPAKKVVKVPVDANDPTKGEKFETKIEPGATIFKLRALDVFLMGWIYDNASSLTGRQGTDEVGIHTKVNQTNIDAVRFGLADVVNFSDHQGPVRMKTSRAVVNGRTYDAAADSIVNMLGVRLIAELATKIKSISEVSPEEEKNSAGA